VVELIVAQQRANVGPVVPDVENGTDGVRNRWREEDQPKRTPVCPTPANRWRGVPGGLFRSNGDIGHAIDSGTKRTKYPL
jgi:hypothetical protein